MITQAEERLEFAEAKLRFWERPWVIVLVAFVLRLAVVPLIVGAELDPARDHWVFGWETGRIARSLAMGRGFGSPLFGWTGPTAWMSPVYPGIVAGVFKILGVYSRASAYLILSLNCLFAALTCLPLRSIARRAFGPTAATTAAWAWALFPYSFDFAAGQVWSTSLCALLLTLAVAMTIALERQPSARSWAVWGITWAIAGLTEPSLLSCLPVAGLWLVYRLRQRGLPWIFFWRPVVAAIAFLVVVSPWFIRNYRVFGQFVPFRNNFWLAFYQGNTWDTSDLYPDWANPPHNAAEMAEYARVGELAYMNEKKQQALAEVREHPARFAWVTLRRVIFTWTGYWDLSSSYRRIEPFALPNVFLATLLSVLAATGLALAFGNVRRFAILFVWLVLALPAVYYISHPSMIYRHPLDPLLVLLAVYVFAGRRSGRETEARPPEAEAEVTA